MKDFVHYEESDFFDIRKESRQVRKIATRRDRSKYKKTDTDKRKKSEEVPHSTLGAFRRGVVCSIRGHDIIVQADGEQHICTLRGVIKKEKSHLKNLIIVGDFVQFDEQNSIAFIEERKTVLSRADHLSQQREHLIAANIDQVLITISVVDPAFRPPIIDRYLAAAVKGGLHPVILCNKIDLFDNPIYPEWDRQKQKELLQECEKVYTSIGVPFIPLSIVTLEGLDRLCAVMKDRISVFSGQSGTGKSSLINATCGLNLKVGRTVLSSKKGAHTTSFAELIALPAGGFVVDTPGIKSFGVWGLEAAELRTLFVDIAQAAKECKYQNCFHKGEDGCAIPKAIEEGIVSPIRYASYLNLLESLENEHLRR